MFFKQYKLRYFIKQYRFSNYGERYVDDAKLAEFMNLEIFAPNYKFKQILAEYLISMSKKEDFVAHHTYILDLLPKVTTPE